jgi:hypothetical protein
MNDQQLEQIEKTLDETLAFQPGGSDQLRPLSKRGQAMIEDAEKLCISTMAAYQEQVDIATARRDAAKGFCDRLMKAVAETAQQVDADGELMLMLLDGFVAVQDRYEATKCQAKT